MTTCFKLILDEEGREGGRGVKGRTAAVRAVSAAEIQTIDGGGEGGREGGRDVPQQ